MLIKAILKNIKDLLPYLLLITIYFFFINLEAGNQRNNVKMNKKETITPTKNKSSTNQQIRISIPVIPYKQR